MMNPSFEDETPVNPFDFWEGANFKMKIRKVDGFSNYDKSEFDNPAPLLEDDDKMEEIWKGEHDLVTSVRVIFRGKFYLLIIILLILIFLIPV